MGNAGNSGQWRGAAVIGLGSSLAPLDTAVNVALPAMTGSFARDVTAAQWIVIAYVLTYASLLLAIGRIGDLFGYRLIFRLGLAWSAAALALCALAPSFAWLLAGRSAQGIGTALVLACGPALLTNHYDERERGRALGLYTMMIALGAGVGPLIGGGLVQLWGWPTVFWFRVPIALGTLALLRGSGDETRHQAVAREPFDLLGAGLFAFALACFLLAVNRLPLLAVGDFSGVMLGILALCGLAGFIKRELGFSAPMIELRVFRAVDFALLNGASVALNLASFAILLLLPYYFSRILGLAALPAGGMLASAAIGTVLGSSLGGRWLGSRGALPIALAGGLVGSLGLVVVGFAAGSSGAAGLIALLLLQGFGLGLFQTAYMDLVVAAIPAGNRGVAGGLAMLTRTLGIITGASLLTVVFHALQEQAIGRAEGAFMAAFRSTFVLAGCLSLAVICAALLQQMLRSKS